MTIHWYESEEVMRVFMMVVVALVLQYLGIPAPQGILLFTLLVGIVLGTLQDLKELEKK